MNSVNILKDLIERSDMTQRELGEKMGWSEAATSNRFRRDAFPADTFLQMLDLLGYDFKIVKKGSDEVVEPKKKGIGEKLRMMVNGITYDTEKSDALCHATTDDIMYELYEDKEGRYFVAIYPLWKNAVNSISPISKEKAHDLIEAFGD